MHPFIARHEQLWRVTIVGLTLLLVAALGFAVGYLVRGDVGPASITIEKCSAR